MRTFSLFVILSLLAGCTTAPQRSGGDILIAGDSVMAWNRTSSRDIGSVVEAELGRTVISRATVGAAVRAGPFGTMGTFGIQNQLSAGRWNWIVMNGGANDLGYACRCARCETTVDMLISKDAKTGAIPDLIASARRQSSYVIWVGYYATPDSRLFKACRPALVEIESRIARYASRTAGVYFVDAETVIDPKRRDLFAFDNTHPSPQGSALIANMVARTISTWPAL